MRSALLLAIASVCLGLCVVNALALNTLKDRDMLPDFSTPVCHLVDLPDPPGGQVELTTTINSYCSQAPEGVDCYTWHLNKVARFVASTTPCEH